MDKLKFPEVSIFDKKKDLKFPSILSEGLAEIVGIHIGDGHLGFRKNRKGSYLFQLGGHLIKDKIYYEKFITPLLKNLFNLKVSPKMICGSIYGYQIYSKGLLFYLKNNFNLPVGKKFMAIDVPKIFFKNKNLLISCIRGIIDTDFYVSFDENFPEVGGWFAGEKLVKTLESVLNNLKFKVKTRYNDKYFDKRTNKYYTRHHISLRGIENFGKWFKTIQTHHPVNYIKYKYWKNGFCLKDKNIITNPQLMDWIAPELYRSNSVMANVV